MLPFLVMHNRHNRMTLHAKPAPEGRLSLGGPTLSDRAHGGGRQLRLWIPFTPPISVAPLRDHVAGVVTNCAEKQVPGVQAAAIVAPMQNVKRVRVHAVRQPPHQMRRILLSAVQVGDWSAFGPDFDARIRWRHGEDLSKACRLHGARITVAFPALVMHQTPLPSLPASRTLGQGTRAVGHVEPPCRLGRFRTQARPELHRTCGPFTGPVALYAHEGT